MTSHELGRLLLSLPEEPEVLCEDPGFVIGAHVSSYSGQRDITDYSCVELEVL